MKLILLRIKGVDAQTLNIFVSELGRVLLVKFKYFH
jgi:hypothetical protein